MREHLLPHERADDSEVYPAIEKALGSADPIAAMHRTHSEMHHLCRQLARMIADMPAEGPSQLDANEFRRVLYGLDAILRLHIAQENELYHSLADADRAPEALSRA